VAIKGRRDVANDDDEEDEGLLLGLSLWVWNGTVKQVLYILLPKDGFPRDCAITVVENNDGVMMMVLSSSELVRNGIWEEVFKFNRRKSNSNGPNLRLVLVVVVVFVVPVVVRKEEDGYVLTIVSIPVILW
jgi:hypothetical protein